MNIKREKGEFISPPSPSSSVQKEPEKKTEKKKRNFGSPGKPGGKSGKKGALEQHNEFYRDVGEVVDEDSKHRQRLKQIRQTGIIVGIVSAWALAVGMGGAAEEGKSIALCLGILADRIQKFEIFPPFNNGSALGLLVGAAAGGVFTWYMLSRAKIDEHYDPEAEVDTGGFMKKEELEEFRRDVMAPEPEPLIGNEPYPFDKEHDREMYSQNMIMSNSFSRPMFTRKLKGNNNVCVIGGSGMGKSRFFIKPNVLQMNASFVITDPSGEMIAATGDVLKKHGYKVKVFNTTEMKFSNTYNPLNYIRDEAGVRMVVECLINNTTGKGKKGDEFFTNAEKLLYSACIFYLIDFCEDDSKKNFANVMDMINASNVDENNPSAESKVDEIFKELPVDSLAYKFYRSFKQAAGKTLKSILISCVTRLQPFLVPQVVNLTSTDSLDLGSLGDEKTALFIITPQADSSYSFLATMLYSQLFETLYFKGEQKKLATGSEELDVPVRCLMDEFAVRLRAVLSALRGPVCTLSVAG